ncbi:MAG: hypothetical protein JSR99_05170 [Proteobacteria bacterium]|nr:hypothetical protein [Pseudomonadota bacterium]
MIRIVIENIFFFLLPTLIYIIWIAFYDNQWRGLGPTLSRAPLIRLFVAGAALMIGTLLVFSSHTYNSPDDVYVPASDENGKLEPAHSIHEPAATEPQTTKP